VIDTNVAAPVLRWMALGESVPSPEIVSAWVWLQQRVRAWVFNPTASTVHVEMDPALAETSRRLGIVDGERYARLAAAKELLDAWLQSPVSIRTRLAADQPALRFSRRIAKASDGVELRSMIAAEVTCLYRLAPIDRRRRSGELRSPKQRLEALEQWSLDVAPIQGMSAVMALVAAQTALGGDGAPARALAKFNEYLDRQAARARAENAAWDMWFLRMARHSETGERPYEERAEPAALVTLDGQLARTAESLLRVVVGTLADGYKASGNTVDQYAHLQRDILNDERMRARYDDWWNTLLSAQRRRRSGAPTVRPDYEALAAAALDSVFDGPNGA
jgi:hypothetical protein